MNLIKVHILKDSIVGTIGWNNLNFRIILYSLERKEQLLKYVQFRGRDIVLYYNGARCNI